MNTNQIKGTVKDVAGMVQRTVGEVTGSTRLQVEGATKQIEGRVQKTVGDAQEAASDAARASRQRS